MNTELPWGDKTAQIHSITKGNLKKTAVRQTLSSSISFIFLPCSQVANTGQQRFLSLSDHFKFGARCGSLQIVCPHQQVPGRELGGSLCFGQYAE